MSDGPIVMLVGIPALRSGPPDRHDEYVCPSGCTEMATVFHVTGALIYVDPDGAPIGYDDVFTRLEKTRQHFAAVGLPVEAVEQLIR